MMPNVPQELPPATKGPGSAPALSRRSLLCASASALGLAACQSPPLDPADPTVKERYIVSHEVLNPRDNLLSFRVRVSDWKRVRVASLVLSRSAERRYPSLTLDLKQLIVSPENGAWLDVLAPFSSWEADGPVNPQQLYSRLLRVVAPDDVQFEMSPIRAIPITARTPLLSLTIDDGLAGANPGIDILRRHGWRGSLFVEPSMIGQPGFLDWPRLRELSAAGWDVGGHFVETNPDALSTAAFDQALANVRARLGGLQGSDQFAYPNGRNPLRARQAAARHFTAAATVDGLSNAPTRIDAHRIARTSLDRWTLIDQVLQRVARAQSSGEWLVLNFHMFEAATGPDENVTPAFLDTLCTGIRQLGVRVLPMSQARQIIRDTPGAQLVSHAPPPSPARGT